MGLGETMWDVLVCEDSDALRESLTDYLMESGEWTVRAACDGLGLRRQFVERVPDMLLLDVGLPGESGVELTRWVRSTYPAVGVVVLSGRFSANDRLEGWRAGADVYLVKPVAPEEVELALKAVLTRAMPVIESERRRNALRLVLARRCLEAADGQCTPLTSREAMALQMLAQSPGVIVASDALRELLWPKEDDDTDYQNALFSLIRRLRRKLEAAGLSPDAIAMVRGRGYRFSQGNSLQLVID